MARQTATVEINTFNAGLNTDASPLTSPENSSLAEENFILNIDGSRNRRLGMDFEENYSPYTDQRFTTPRQLSTFLWENAGGFGSDFLVVWTGNVLNIFSTTSRPYSSTPVFTQSFYPPALVNITAIDMTSINGILVAPMDTGVLIIEYDGSTFTHSFHNLQVRDLFGLDDVAGAIDLNDGNNIASRPDALTDAHTYNLRNQGWGMPRPTIVSSDSSLSSTDSTVVVDPITAFYEYTGDQYYPSNADAPNQAYFADPTSTESATLRRFSPEDLIKNPIGSMPAAKGYFIINPFNRAASRDTAYDQNQARYPELDYDNITQLADSSQVFGNNLVTERFAGRVWYSGYSPNNTSFIDTTPTIGSFVFFSQVVKTLKNIYKCYQEGDPTSPDMPDIVDTDGGFINITGAENIIGLEAFADGLIVLAENGVWIIRGISDSGFTASGYAVEKITDRGCISRHTIVSVGSSIFYWGRDGIYVITPNQYGELEAQRVSEGKIQNLLFSIDEDRKRDVHGVYDVIERKIKWLYDNQLDFNYGTKELVLDLQLGSFYLHHIKGYDQFSTKPIGYIEIPDSNRSINYIAAFPYMTYNGYSFADYTDEGFVDWRSADGVGVDADAFLITSYVSGGDFQRNKNVPYITVHLKRTETGIIDDNGDSVFINPSSCLMQARWDWSDTSNSNKWGRVFQAYRYKRDYIPVSLPDDFDTGFLMISTKNRLRGYGKVLSLRFFTEPGKDLHLYGWSMILSMEEKV